MSAEEVEVKEQPKEQKSLRPISLDEQGLVQVTTLDEEMRICKGLVDNNMVPESLNTPGKLFAARQLCRELNLPVMSAIRQVYVVNGSPSLWGDTPLGIVRRSGQLESIDEYTIDDQYNRIGVENKNLTAPIFAAVCEIQRKGYVKKTFFFTVEQAKAAGLMGKSLYSKYFQRMIQMKARGLGLKNEFSDILMGIAMAEYDYDEVPGVAREVSETVADKANKVFSEEVDTAEKPVST